MERRGAHPQFLPLDWRLLSHEHNFTHPKVIILGVRRGEGNGQAEGAAGLLGDRGDGSVSGVLENIT